MAFVLGSIVALLFQTGADKRVIEAVLPRLENRFDIQVTYDGLSASLTGLTLEKVELRSASGKSLFATIDRLGISFRVGPLFFGKLDITGIRLDGLQVRIGEKAEGASISDWRELAKRVGRQSSKGEGEPKTSRPEIYVENGRIGFAYSQIAISFEGIIGRISPDGRAVLEAGKYKFKHKDHSLLKGHMAEIQYLIDKQQISAKVEQPSFRLPASRKQLLSLVRDIHASLNLFRESQRKDDSKNQNKRKKGKQLFALKEISAVIVDASATIFNPDETDKQLSFDGITANVSTTKDGSFFIRASGQSPGTDVQSVLELKIPAEGNPTVKFEIPDMSLAHLGDVVFPSKHIQWDQAFTDSAITVEIARQGQEIIVYGQTALQGVTIEHSRLTEEPLRDFKVHGDFKMAYDRKEGVLHLERFLVSLGLARATIRGDIWPGRLAFDLSLHMPPTACQQVKAAVPKVIAPRIQNVRLSGQIGLDLHLAIDDEKPEETVLETTLDNQCRIVAFGDIPKPSYFRGPFAYVTYTEKGKDLRLITGQGTDRWTPLMAISPYVIGAVLTTEDGKFWNHKGMTIPEIKRAITLNLKKDALRHGASTITMQLAKNLFLTRERNVARKLQELFFVWYLESNFEKEEILELYLNIVEFGPSIYGISDAAMHYFGRDPSELNALESVFLIKLLPNPVTRHKSYDRNKVSKRLMGILHRVLETMKTRGHLTEIEYANGIEQDIVFYREGDPFPEPRPPAMRTGIDQPLEANDEQAKMDNIAPEAQNWDEVP